MAINGEDLKSDVFLGRSRTGFKKGQTKNGQRERKRGQPESARRMTRLN